MFIIKIIFIIVIIIIFLIVITKQIEYFTDKNYINNNIYNTNFNKLYSCLPYDIKVKNEKLSIYDYDNSELNEKFAIIYKLNNIEKQIKLLEGINWSCWKLPNDISYLSSLRTYYDNIINKFEEGLNNDIFKLENNDNFKIIDKTLNRYKKNIDDGNMYILDIDVIIYRNNKPLARHIKIIAISTPLKHYFILIKVIGVIPQNDLLKSNVISASLNNNYVEFIPERIILYDNNDYIFDLDEKRSNSEVSYNIYNKLLKDLTS